MGSRLFHKGCEAGLLKMVVTGESISDAFVLHDHKGDAIGQWPFLVEAMSIKMNTIVQEFTRSGDDRR